MSWDSSWPRKSSTWTILPTPSPRWSRRACYAHKASSWRHSNAMGACQAGVAAHRTGKSGPTSQSGHGGRSMVGKYCGTVGGLRRADKREYALSPMDGAAIATAGQRAVHRWNTCSSAFSNIFGFFWRPILRACLPQLAHQGGWVRQISAIQMARRLWHLDRPTMGRNSSEFSRYRPFGRIIPEFKVPFGSSYVRRHHGHWPAGAGAHR